MSLSVVEHHSDWRRPGVILLGLVVEVGIVKHWVNLRKSIGIRALEHGLLQTVGASVNSSHVAAVELLEVEDEGLHLLEMPAAIVVGPLPTKVSTQLQSEIRGSQAIPDELP